MKKYIVPLLLGILILVGCSSNKPSENAQKAIDEIINYENRHATTEIDTNAINENFSFKIYEDSNTNYYLIEAYIPSADQTEANKFLHHYLYDVDNNDLTYYAADYDYNKKMDSGDYTVIYKSGKFAE